MFGHQISSSVNDPDFYNTDLPEMGQSGEFKISRDKKERTRFRLFRKPWLLYPENQNKVNWELFITLILLISCFITPLRIAFGEVTDPVEWQLLNYFIDSMFLVDILVIFNSVLYDDNFELIEDRKLIAFLYLEGWFLIDILAIIPFELFVNPDKDSGANYQDLTRIVRLGKISKLIKMTRLLRILKLMKERSKLLKYLNEILKIGLGFERLVFFIILFFILAHIVACIWVITT